MASNDWRPQPIIHLFPEAACIFGIAYALYLIIIQHNFRLHIFIFLSVFIVLFMGISAFTIIYRKGAATVFNIHRGFKSNEFLISEFEKSINLTRIKVPLDILNIIHYNFYIDDDKRKRILIESHYITGEIGIFLSRDALKYQPTIEEVIARIDNKGASSPRETY